MKNARTSLRPEWMNANVSDVVMIGSMDENFGVKNAMRSRHSLITQLEISYLCNLIALNIIVFVIILMPLCKFCGVVHILIIPLYFTLFLVYFGTPNLDSEGSFGVDRFTISRF